jgi:hypothetical protein
MMQRLRRCGQGFCGWVRVSRRTFPSVTYFPRKELWQSNSWPSVSLMLVRNARQTKTQGRRVQYNKVRLPGGRRGARRRHRCPTARIAPGTRCHASGCVGACPPRCKCSQNKNRHNYLLTLATYVRARFGMNREAVPNRARMRRQLACCCSATAALHRLVLPPCGVREEMRRHTVRSARRGQRERSVERCSYRRTCAREKLCVDVE